MTQKKVVAKTLKDLHVNPIVTKILDRNSDIDGTMIDVLNYWSYDLFSRRPSPAYVEDGIFTGTDLDMAAFLFALVDRGAVIEIPNYKGFRARTKTEGERKIDPKQSFGKLTNIISNKDTFNFSIRLFDSSVIGTDYVGAFRTRTLTDFWGKWYKGWDHITFKPTAKENEFITNNELWTGHKIIFTNFVSPNRWVSVFGQYYITTKLLISRLEEQNKNLYQQIKRMLEAGLSYPPEEKKEWPKSEVVGETKKITVSAFHMEVDFPNNESEFPIYKDSQENLIKLTYKRRGYSNILEKLRFICRTSEYAHYSQQNRFPAWIKGARWEYGYVEKGKRTAWDRLILHQPKVGELGISIRRRTFDKTETVDINY